MLPLPATENCQALCTHSWHAWHEKRAGREGSEPHTPLPVIRVGDAFDVSIGVVHPNGGSWDCILAPIIAQLVGSESVWDGG